jgi:hypothetical protein
MDIESNQTLRIEPAHHLATLLPPMAKTKRLNAMRSAIG